MKGQPLLETMKPSAVLHHGKLALLPAGMRLTLVNVFPKLVLEAPRLAKLN